MFTKFIDKFHSLDFEMQNVDCVLSLYRYRFGHISNQFREHIYKYNIF